MPRLSGADNGEGSSSRRVDVDDNEDQEEEIDPERLPRGSSELEPLSESEASKQSTRSVSQSQIEDHSENGRQYGSRIYYMPADDTEQTRLAVVHQAYLPILEGNLTLAAVPRSVEYVLDIGTGTGDWAIAMAERFPKAEITATDITPVFQPSQAPENIFFELDDAQEEWTYTDPFDLIHVRGLMGAFSDWSKVYREASKHLKRGGTLEVADMGMIRLTAGPASSQLDLFNQMIQSAAQQAGTPVDLEHHRRSAFEDSGLSVVKTKAVDVPLGTWSPDPRRRVAGKMALISMLEGLEAMSLRLLTRHLEYTEDDVRSLCEKVKEEILDETTKPVVHVSFVVARKIM